MVGCFHSATCRGRLVQAAAGRAVLVSTYVKDVGVMSVYTREELDASLQAVLRDDPAGLWVGGGLILHPREREAIIEWAARHGVRVRKPQIKRGDVLASADDAARYEMPVGTAFRDRDGIIWGSIPVNSGDYEKHGPYRCIDVPCDDDD